MFMTNGLGIIHWIPLRVDTLCNENFNSKSFLTTIINTQITLAKIKIIYLFIRENF